MPHVTRKIVSPILISLLLTSAVTGLLFQIPKVANAQSSLLIGIIADSGIDTDSNGFYDFLKIEVELNVTQPGYYNLNAQGLINGTRGSNASSTFVSVWDSKYVYLDTGAQIVTLYFFGSIIHASGIINASYVDSISVSAPYGGYEYLNWVPLSQNYSYYQFDLDAMLTGNVTDMGIDTDSNGDFDYLLLGVETDVTTPGDYTVSASGLGPISIDTSMSIHLETGLQTINVTFSGPRIYVSGMNFSSINMVQLTENGLDPEGQRKWWNIDTKFWVPLSREYSYAEFDALAKLTGTIHDRGVDEDSDGDFDYLRVGVEVQVFDAGDYRVSASGLANATNTFWISDAQYVHLEVGLNIVNMSFYGPAIYHAGIDPSMVVSIDLVSTGPQEWLGLGILQNVSLSRTYLHTEFDASAYLTGKIYDRGIDTDGNGKFDYLEVSVEVQVEDPGNYEVEVEGLSNGINITYYEYYYPSRKSVYLTAGTNLVNFSFYGPRMAYYQFSPKTVIQITLISPQPIPSRPPIIYGPPQGWIQTIKNVSLSRPYQYTEFDAPSRDMEMEFLVYPNGSVLLSGSYNYTDMEYPNQGPQIEQSLTVGKNGDLTVISTNGKFLPPQQSSQNPYPWYQFYPYASSSEWPYNSSVVHAVSSYSAGILSSGVNASVVLPPEGAFTYPFNASDFSLSAAYLDGILTGTLDASTTLPPELAQTLPFNITDFQLKADYATGMLKGNVTLSLLSGLPIGSLTLNFQADKTDVLAYGSLNVIYGSYPIQSPPLVINETIVDMLIGNVTSLEGTGPNSIYNMTQGTIEFLGTSTITKTPIAGGATITFNLKFHGDLVRLVASIMSGSFEDTPYYRDLYDLVDSAITSVQDGSIVLSYSKASSSATLHATFTDDLRILVKDVVTYLNQTIFRSYPDYARASALTQLHLANATFNSLQSFELELAYSSLTKTADLNFTAASDAQLMLEGVKKALMQNIPPETQKFIEELLNTTYCNVYSADGSLTYQNGEADFQATITLEGDFEKEINHVKNAYINYTIETYKGYNYTLPIPWQLYFINQTQIDASAFNFNYKIAETSTYWRFDGLVVSSPIDPVDLTSFKLNRFFNVTNEQYEPPNSGERMKITVQGGVNGTNIVTLIRPSTVPTPDFASEDGTLMIWNNQSISGLRDLTFHLKYYTDIVYSAQTYRVITGSNGTVSPVTFDHANMRLSLTVNGPTGTTGYANISIPKALMNAATQEWVIVIGTDIILYPNYNITETTTTTYLHVTFTFSSPMTITITGTEVVTEFPTFLIMPVFIALTIAAIAILKKRTKKPKL